MSRFYVFALATFFIASIVTHGASANPNPMKGIVARTPCGGPGEPSCDWCMMDPDEMCCPGCSHSSIYGTYNNEPYGVITDGTERQLRLLRENNHNRFNKAYS
ncbi:hypothetical protein SISNIDRAFT_496459 [Sistotremastrum niveocremeum HHB9708]|uniref:Uncharacterized protein n=1 Tax=Sistotremastrum niveocremeum HHB9708 TaxID=1314777 RepID=A0A164SJC9_9AGAM|nr:hypothetical protein SISNIDRAFT_496459 [Sistotremastrum niveocremeum HHB9708]